MTAPVLAIVAVAIAIAIVVICWRYRRTAGLLAAMLVMWCFVAVFAFMHGRQAGDAGPASATADVTANAPATGASATASAADPTSLTLLADDLGHFHVDGLVNGALVHFIVDTGATAVMLGKDDARRAGFNPDTLAYQQPITTANGTIQGADIVIYQLVVGPMRLVNVRGAVVPGDTLSSLLGISFLSRIGSYEVNGNTMILHQ